MKEPVPDFVLAGFPKCATTTLASRLATHPDICFSDPKEPNTMVDPEQNAAVKPIPYSQAFAHRKEGQLLGEGTVRYGMTQLYADIPKKLGRLAPEARIVFVVRDPVARAISHWRMLWTEAPDLLSPEEMLRVDWAFDALVGSGQYRQHIEAYLRYFPEEQILITEFNEVVKSGKAIDEVLTFLGLEPAPATMDREVSTNVTGSNRAQPGVLLQRLRSTGVSSHLAKLLPTSLKDRVRNQLSNPPPSPEVTAKFEEVVLQHCEEDYRWAVERSATNGSS